MSQEAELRAFSEVRRDAGELLAQRGNRLTLIMAILVCLLFVPMYLMLVQAFSVLVTFFLTDLTASVIGMVVFFALMVLLTLFLTLPTVLGLFFMASEMTRGERPVLADLFFFFTTGRRYRRALSVSVRWVLRFCIVAALLLAVYLVSVFVIESTFEIFWIEVTVITAIFLGGVLWCLSSYSELYFVLTYPEKCVGEATKTAHKTGDSTLTRGIRFAVGFLFWIALGLLTCGILLLWDTLPRMLIAYFCDCREEERRAAAPPDTTPLL